MEQSVTEPPPTSVEIYSGVTFQHKFVTITQCNLFGYIKCSNCRFSGFRSEILPGKIVPLIVIRIRGAET